MQRLADIGYGLQALEVAEQRELAGRIAAILYLIGAVTALILIVMPESPVTNPAALYAVSGVGFAWSAVCLFAIDWRNVRPWVSHVSSGMGLPITAVAMAASGGWQSPTRFYLLFVVFYASYFYPPREAIPHLIGCILVLALPLAYEPNAVSDGLLADLLVLGPTFAVLGALIMGGRHILLTVSRQDPLTGLVNRRAFDERLGSSVGGRGASASFGLMLCDLNSFKSVNDHHGHPQGDRVLRQTAKVLQATVREVDEVARVGGDEFAIVVDGADEATMSSLAERVRAELRLAGNELGLGDDYRLEASIGWAIFPREADSTESLVALADAALREQKLLNDRHWPRRGRVPVSMVGPMTEHPLLIDRD